jgi:transcriptional regulator with XRE-family HTH domain
MQAKRRFSKVDDDVGRNVRLRRMQLRISQTELANELGVSFQQVQKYEKGTNRISAGRLQRIAEYLNVPVSFFFAPTAGMSEQSSKVLEFLEGAYSLRLLQAFSKIRDKRLQLTVLELVEQIAKEI